MILGRSTADVGSGASERGETDTMGILWTPWRMAYLTGDRHEGCVLCDKPRAPQSEDRANLVLHRSALCYVVLNLYPYNTGHVMVVPYRHASSLDELDADTRSALMALAEMAVRVVRRAYAPAGFNLGMNIGKVAGAGIADHVHLHVVPRWDGDTNYMPVLGATKVLPETLETTYDRLCRAWQEEERAAARS